MNPVTLLHIRVDESLKTKVDGLYAIPWSLLSMSAVNGLMAGRSAAQNCKATTHLESEQHDTVVSKLKSICEAILNREGPHQASWQEAQKAIFQLMHCYALPPQRTEGTLEAGYHQLNRLRDKARTSLKAGNPHDLYHCIEVLNLLDVAELVLLAVKERKESRGQSKRMDYPFMNPMLNHPMVISQKDGRPVFKW
jgi:succinate dehydrogenase/fumarate reductase flavoprotein subunit